MTIGVIGWGGVLRTSADGTVYKTMNITPGEAFAFFHWYHATYWITDPPAKFLEHVYFTVWLPIQQDKILRPYHWPQRDRA